MILSVSCVDVQPLNLRMQQARAGHQNSSFLPKTVGEGGRSMGSISNV